MAMGVTPIGAPLHYTLTSAVLHTSDWTPKQIISTLLLQAPWNLLHNCRFEAEYTAEK